MKQLEVRGDFVFYFIMAGYRTACLLVTFPAMCHLGDVDCIARQAMNFSFFVGEETWNS